MARKVSCEQSLQCPFNSLLPAELRIRPPGSGPDNSIYVLSVGSRLELECQLDRGDFSGTDDVNALDWMRGKLRIAHNWLRSLRRTLLLDLPISACTRNPKWTTKVVGFAKPGSFPAWTSKVWANTSAFSTMTSNEPSSFMCLVRRDSMNSQ